MNTTRGTDTNTYRRTDQEAVGTDVALSPDLDEQDLTLAEDLHDEIMTVNMGPQHPSTHGVLRVVLDLDGEKVVGARPDIGYLHTGIEKTIESKRYEAGLTCTDRMDYLSPMSNNLGYCMAIEKILDCAVPERAQWMRMLLVELQRIASHMVWLGTHALDLGAMTVFLYCFRDREVILDLFEMVSGARMMSSYIRVGGLESEVPDAFYPAVEAFLDVLPGRIDEYETLLTKNEIWIERLQGVGVIGAQEAIDYGLTGPSLRGSGVQWDLRKDQPYLMYDQVEFNVPVGARGDCYARYMVRVQEMRQSYSLCRQIMAALPRSGPYRVADRKIVPPPKEELAISMEAVIHHFKLATEGLHPPAGDVYVALESPRGEFGIYLVSDGSNKPYRCHVRAPSLYNITALDRLCRGHLVADVVAIIGSIDIVLGEVDR
jgi:NADH-quinone oxidoreductase subunit D